MPHAGVSFVNSQMMATVDIKDTNRGPLKFTNCGFWGIDQRGAERMGFPDRATRSHATIRGTGHVTFNACHFTNWNKQDKNDPAIIAHSGGLTVNCCEFMEAHRSIVLEKDVEAAIVTSNRFREDAPEVENNMTPELAQIGFNVRAVRSGRKEKDRA